MIAVSYELRRSNRRSRPSQIVIPMPGNIAALDLVFPLVCGFLDKTFCRRHRLE
jgi:hypothetical protein